MEDSLELPDDSEYLDVHTLLSPEPLIQDSRENSPPHSLAYSNCTFPLIQPPASRIATENCS
jgi:hypothetical protein